MVLLPSISGRFRGKLRGGGEAEALGPAFRQRPPQPLEGPVVETSQPEVRQPDLEREEGNASQDRHPPRRGDLPQERPPALLPSLRAAERCGLAEDRGLGFDDPLHDVCRAFEAFQLADFR